MSSKMKERLHTGEIYLPGDDEILEEQFQCQEKLYDYNQTRPSEGEKRSKLLKEMFAEIGDGLSLIHIFQDLYNAWHRKEELPKLPEVTVVNKKPQIGSYS